MSDHGFSVCGIYAEWPPCVVLDCYAIAPGLDRCDTGKLERYSPPPPWRWYLDSKINGSIVNWWRDRLPYLEWWFDNMCRDMACDYCAASGETTNE